MHGYLPYFFGDLLAGDGEGAGKVGFQGDVPALDADDGAVQDVPGGGGDGVGLEE